MHQPGPCCLILVVLYKTDIGDAATLQSLPRSIGGIHTHSRLVIWDNSPEPQASEAIEQYRQAAGISVTYRHTPENLSLAFIYNRVASENGEAEWLYVFDQDSTFDSQFFSENERAAAAHPAVNLLLPLIRNGHTIVSPGSFRLFKGKYWKAPQYGLVASRGHVAIASGMAIRMTYLVESGGFDERLQLYGIDTNFMLRYAKTNNHFFVLDVPFHHDLSDFKDESPAVKRQRFQDFKKASLLNSSLFPLPVRWLTRLFLWYREIQLS